MSERDARILEILTAEKKVEVSGLAQRLGVSSVTIRKDLDALEARCVIERRHGWASLGRLDDINGRLAYHYEEKCRIARAAAELISEGDTVMIENGSCCALLADELVRTRRDVSIVTNSAFIDFSIVDDIAFDDVGSQIGTKWAQVNLGKGGTHENPKGTVFESPSDLLAFHHGRTKRDTDTEEYLWIAPAQLTVTYNKGADDATGVMTLQVYDVGTTETLSKNAYKRAGYALSGWRDSEGNVYTDEHALENNYFGKAAPGEEAQKRTLELMAQWRPVLTYRVKKFARCFFLYRRRA